MIASMYGGTKIVPSEQHPLASDFKIDSYITALHKHGIDDWEQLYSIMSNEERQKSFIKKVLKMPVKQGVLLKEAMHTTIPRHSLELLQSATRFSYPLGAQKPLKKDIITENKVFSKKPITATLHSIDKMISWSEADNEMIASSINYVSELPPIKDQGDRGTCVAFAVTAINEYSFQREKNTYTDLSEQYLFCETKKLENNNACSSLISKALQVISKQGQCPERVWSYNPNFPCVQSVGKPSTADQLAVAFSNKYIIYNSQNDLIAQIKSSVSMGRLAALSIPVFKSWLYNAELPQSGRIIMPDPDEEVMQDNNGNDYGHAVAIVGYQDFADSPGGGYFIIRNSWGTQKFGSANIYGAGYGIIPYDFVRKYRWEVYAL